MIASSPNDGPTTSDWTISAVAGNLPAPNILVNSCASSIVKFPEILELPPAIASLTCGAE